MPAYRYTESSPVVHADMARRPEVPPYYGEPRKFDPTFSGPIRNRSCTDVLCCVLFIIIILAYIVLGIVAWLQGDPRKVLYPTDSYGHVCGQHGPNANKTVLFYFNILKCASPAVLVNLQCPTTQMCVSRCPQRFLTYTEVQVQYQLMDLSVWSYYRQFCRPGFNNPAKPVGLVLRDEDCPSMIVPSRPFLQRCFPDFITLNGTLTVANRTAFSDALDTARSVVELRDAANGVTSLVDTKDVGMKILEDLASSWTWILLGLVLALLVSLVFIVLLRFTAGLLLRFTIASLLLGVTYGIFHSYRQWCVLRGRPGAEVSLSEVGFQTDLTVYLHLSQTWMGLSIVLGIVEATMLLMLVFLRRRVGVAIALLREGSRAVSHIMSTLFYPIITFLLLALAASYWATTAVFLASSGEAVYKVAAEPDCRHANQTCHPETFNRTNTSVLCPGSRCVFARYGGEGPYQRLLPMMQLANLLAFLWLANFLLALGQVTLAGAFSSYYWARRKPQDIPPCPLLGAFCTALRYHTGSLALGSLVLAMVQMVRIVLEYLEQHLRGSDNAVARFLFCCLRCCFWCLERFIRFLNRNAYIMIAIYGKNFCTSARDAFCLLMRNVVRVAVLDRVTDFLLFLGKVLIAGSMGVIAFFFFTRRIPFLQEEVPTLHYYWVPLVTVTLGSYLIAHAFFSVYAMCVDTLFLCFCDDLERNDGSPERPYLMSPELHSILGKAEPQSPRKTQR